MIRSNRNLFRVFPTRVSPALRYPNKVVRYFSRLRATSVEPDLTLTWLWSVNSFEPTTSTKGDDST